MNAKHRYRTTDTISRRRLGKMREVLLRRQFDATIVMENVHDPHNVSAVLRTADAVGLNAVHVVYSHEKMPRIGKKSSASAKKWITVHHHESIMDSYAVLRSAGLRIFASRIGEDSISLYDLDLTAPVALVLGNEHRGVSREACELADERFKIPMMGMIQSLNISVAAAVCLYELLRQRAAKGFYVNSGIEEDDLREILKDWASR